LQFATTSADALGGESAVKPDWLAVCELIGLSMERE
jgi:hypothetical protein